MISPPGQFETELDQVTSTFGSAAAVTEAGRNYVYIANLKLPEGCTPVATDALLRTEANGDGYDSRLYFAVRVTGLKTDSLNWQAPVRLADRSWHFFSWTTDSRERSLTEKLMLHLRPLVVGKP